MTRALATAMVLFSALTASASPRFELGQSVTGNYDSRSLFANPAAFGFDTELEGAHLSTSHIFGTQNGTASEWESSLAYGAFGAGLERLTEPTGSFTRYHFGLGFPLGHVVFGGIRYSFSSSDIASLSGITSLDFGIQIRPSHYWSLGFVAANTSRLIGAVNNAPTTYTGGIAVRPIDRIELNADLSTPSDAFLNTITWQTNVRVEPVNGLKIFAGYHSTNQFQCGAIFHFGNASLVGASSLAAGRERALVGIQLSSEPYKSLIRSSTTRVTIDSSLSETPIRGGLFGRDRLALYQLLNRFEKISRDDRIEKVMIRLDAFPLGYAAAQEVNDALWRLRGAGKKVEIFIENTDLKEYLIASAANTIHIERTADLRFPGLKIERYYLKDTLEKIGVEGQFLARGEYKSAPEMFTRSGASPASKDQIMSDLKKAEEEIILQLAKSNRITAKNWPEILKRGVLSAKEAKEMGLVDDISNYSQANPSPVAGSPQDTLAEHDDVLNLPDRVAVIVAQGDILSKKVRFLTLTGSEQITPEGFEKKLRMAMRDPRIKAIVVRVSSPGGEVVASDQIASLIESARKEKPVVISMGDMAASGGYLISGPGEKIFAKSLTLTGSIGVFMGKFNLGNLYKKIGLNKEILSYAPHAGVMSEDRPWTKEEREILVKRLNQYYEGFVEYVATQRKLTAEQAESAAKGRVWLGKDALRLKLVDADGGYHEAIEYAAKSASLPPGLYESVIEQEPRGLLDLFGESEPFVSESPLAGLPFEGLETELRQGMMLKNNPYLYYSSSGNLR